MTIGENVRVYPRLTREDQLYYWYLRHSYVGGRDYAYPPKGTADAARGRIIRRYPTNQPDEQGRPEWVNETVGGNSYLYPHPREGLNDFEIRRLLTRVPRLCSPAVNEFVSTAFKSAPKRVLPAALEGLRAAGHTSLDEFAQDVLRWLLVYGHVWVVADLPAEVEYATLEEQQRGEAASGIRGPQSMIVAPQHMLWWHCDARGRCLGALIEEGPVDDGDATPYRDPGMEPGGEPMARLRYWTPDLIQELHVQRDGHAVSGRVVSEREGYGFVPISCAVFRRQPDAGDMRGDALISGLADAQHDIYNHTSWLVSMHRDQGFPVLGVPYDLGAGKVASQAEVHIGTKRALPFQTGSQPVWLSPPTEQCVEMRTHIESTIAQARDEVGLARRSDSSSQASGIAEEWQHAVFFALCAEAGAAMECWERCWHEHRVALVEGNAPHHDESIEIDYVDDFGPVDRDRAVARLDAFMQIGVGGAFEREMVRDAARAILPDLGEELAREVDEDIVERTSEEKQVMSAANKSAVARAGQAPSPLMAAVTKMAVPTTVTPSDGRNVMPMRKASP